MHRQTPECVAQNKSNYTCYVHVLLLLLVVHRHGNCPENYPPILDPSNPTTHGALVAATFGQVYPKVSVLDDSEWDNHH